MDKDTELYIKNNMQKLKEIMTCFKTLSLQIKNNEEFNYNNSNINVDELKLVMLTFLLSGNFDNIIDAASFKLKDELVNNVPKHRVSSPILFENGQLFDIGSGLQVINRPLRITDSDKLIKAIRDSIAHSQYKLVNGQVHIKNRDFEAVLTIGWLEYMTMGLFSNRSMHSNMVGVSDSLIYTHNIIPGYVNSEADLKRVINNFYNIEITMNKNATSSSPSNGEILTSCRMGLKQLDPLVDKIKKSDMSELSKEFELLQTLDDALNIIKNSYKNIFDFKITKLDDGFIKEFSSIKNIIYGQRTVRELSVVIADKAASYKNDEKRNMIAYKRILEFIEITSKGPIENLLNYPTVAYIDQSYQFLFKTYMNLVFNYAKEQAGKPFDILRNKNKIKVMLPNYVKIRTEEMKLANARLKVAKPNTQAATDQINKITRLNNEIIAYKNGTLDYNKICTEHMRNSLAHNNIEFHMIVNTNECTFTDKEDLVNFKAIGSTDDFIKMGEDYINQITKTKQNVL